MDKNESSSISRGLNGTGGTKFSGNVYHQDSSSSLLLSSSLHPVRDAQGKLSSRSDHGTGQQSCLESKSSSHFSWNSRNALSTHPRPYSSFASNGTPAVPVSLSLTSHNMAETVAVGASPARTPPLVNGGTQRLDELAVKQSRQLIPVMPPAPKIAVAIPSDKSKLKIGQHYRSLNQVRGGIGRADGLKTASETRLQVLKPSTMVSGVASAKRDGSINGSKPFDSRHASSHAAYSSSIALSGSISSEISERKPGPNRVTVEKRLTAQAQSRNDFFNLLKQKASGNSSPGGTNCASDHPAVSSSNSEKPQDFGEHGLSALVSNGRSSTAPSETSVPSFPADRASETRHEDGVCGGSQKSNRNAEKHSDSCAFLCSDEEEAAFLRSLGWEESVEDDGGLTEEEIMAFYQECLKLETSVKLLSKLQSTLPLHLHGRSRGDTASA